MIKSKSLINNDLFKDIFKFEKAIFGDYYLLCPASFELFQKQRPIGKLCGTFFFINKTIISAMIFERLSKTHYHCVMIGTLKGFRNMGYFNLVCQESVSFLKDLHVKYISLWTAEDNDVCSIIKKYATQINTDKNLNQFELSLKNEFLNSRNIINNMDVKRRALDFYKMKDGSLKSGLFWVFKTI